RPSDAGNASLAIELVDHASFRRFSPDPAVYERDMRQLRTNLDAARALGIRRYVIFGDELERLLTYDVDLAGIEGGLGRRAFPADGSWRREAALYRDLMRWAIDAAAARKVGLVLHANQIELPEPVLTLLQGRVVEGDTICADRELTWTLYRAKLGELFDALPGLAGLQITADETEQGLGRCDGPEADPDTPAGAEALLARVDRLLNESAAVARPRGIEIEGRSWGRIYALEEQLDPDRMFDGLDPGIVLSLKNTRGDFHRFSPPSPLIGRGDGARQVLEFDAWREHEGWNLYPCYMGDEWAPRVAAARAAGIRRLALRIGWDQPVQPLFETPWGNGVNLALLRGLAADADADPDRLLRDWIDATWPEGSRAAAFRLYKQSPALMTAVHAQGSEAATDHSRLFRLRDGVDAFERIDGRLGWLQKAGELRKAGDFAARRAAIDAAYADAEALVDALGEDAPAGWRSELAAGARAQWRVGRGATDQLELRFWTREGAPVPPAGRLEALKSQAAADNADWLAEDPERYRLLEGAQLPALLDRLP
ncbi:MAG: hypothetical protein KDH92_00635, partial [Chloroflexi bacterium]|nr:hypothetical protein [Chloroflexota bacterium]